MIKVTVNDQPYQYVQAPSLGELLGQLPLSGTQGIAVAINETVIPRADWDQTRVQHQDQILIIQATQGG